jgi:hypothetical protein
MDCGAPLTFDLDVQTLWLRGLGMQDEDVSQSAQAAEYLGE